MSVIIGIAGAKHTGKDTLAQFLLDYAKANSKCETFVVTFADPIKRMLLPLGYPAEILWGPSEGRNWVHPVFSVSARVMLQRIGTEVARQADPDFWVKAWCHTVDLLSTGNYDYSAEVGLAKREQKPGKLILVVASDLRFANEHAALQQRDAYTVLVERAQDIPVDSHVSEQWCRAAAGQCVQRVIDNNGTLDELAAQARSIFSAALCERVKEACTVFDKVSTEDWGELQKTLQADSKA